MPENCSVPLFWMILLNVILHKTHENVNQQLACMCLLQSSLPPYQLHQRTQENQQTWQNSTHHYYYVCFLYAYKNSNNVDENFIHWGQEEEQTSEIPCWQEEETSPLVKINTQTKPKMKLWNQRFTKYPKNRVQNSSHLSRRECFLRGTRREMVSTTWKQEWDIWWFVVLSCEEEWEERFVFIAEMRTYTGQPYF